MHNLPPYDSDAFDDRDVEIVDLDPPKPADSLSAARRGWLLLRERLRSRRLRTGVIGFACLSALLAFALIYMGGLPLPQAAGQHPSAKNATAGPQFTFQLQPGPPAFAVSNGLAYLTEPDGDVFARHVEDGSFAWWHKLPPPALRTLVATPDTVYSLARASDRGRLDALRASNGDVLWSQRTEAPGPPPAMSRAEGVVYVGTQNGVVYAYDARSGTLLWRYSTGMTSSLDTYLFASGGLVALRTHGSAVHILRARDGVEISNYFYQFNNYPWRPQIAGSSFYITSALHGWVRAVRSDNGAMLWQHFTEGETTWSAEAVNGNVYVDGGQDLVLALRAGDGGVRWQYQGHGGASFAPLVQKGVAYLAMRDGTVLALRESDGRQLWSTGPAPWLVTQLAPILDNGILYLLPSIGENSVVALQASDGRVLWQHMINSATIHGLPHAANGIFYFWSDERTLAAWAGNSGMPLWLYISSQPIFWNPVVSDGLFYIRHQDGSLDVVRLNDGSILWSYSAPLSLRAP